MIADITLYIECYTAIFVNHGYTTQQYDMYGLRTNITPVICVSFQLRWSVKRACQRYIGMSVDLRPTTRYLSGQFTLPLPRERMNSSANQ